MKEVRGKIYLHKSAIPSLENNLKLKTELALNFLPSNYEWNILRLDSSNKVVFLHYPKFEEDPHPSLKHSMMIDIHSGKTKFRTFSSNNSPILHRKETFLKVDDKNYEIFSRLTKQEDKAGLLDPSISHRIGFKKQWKELLNKRGFKIINHELLPINN